MPERDDAKARIERADALRRQIARLKNPTSDAAAAGAQGEDESPQEFVERRMREIAKVRSARKSANKKVTPKRRPAR